MSNPFEDLRQAVVVRPMNSPGPQGVAGPELKIQYSYDGSSWHDTYAEYDRYLRFSTDNGVTWSNAIYFNNLSETLAWVEKARQWAENPENDEVEIGQYSALHHAAKSARSASNAEAAALDAAESAVEAFGAAAPPWNSSTIYNYNDVVSFDNGHTYRCVGTNVVGTDHAPNINGVDNEADWTRITVSPDGYFEIDENGNLMPMVTPINSEFFMLDENGDIACQPDLLPPYIKIQYSPDAQTWHETPTVNDVYIRFTTDNGVTWGEPIRYTNLNEMLKYVEKAKLWAINPENEEVEPGLYSSLHYASKSESWVDKARQWAENPEDEEVEPDQYSALHHALKAAMSEVNAETAALSAAKSAADAFGAAAPAWDSVTVYNYNDVVSFNNGHTYRCIGTGITGADHAPNIDNKDNTEDWTRITVSPFGFFEIDENNDFMPMITPLTSEIFMLDENGDITYDFYEDIDRTGIHAYDENMLRNIIADANGDPISITIYNDIFIITDNLTVPSNVHLNFEKDGRLSPGNGIILTINGSVSAESWQRIFGASGTLKGPIKNGVVFSNWFDNDLFRILDIIESKNATIKILSPVTISSNITIPNNIELNFEGDGKLIANAGVTVTLNCGIRAEMRQIFNGDGTFNGTPAVDAVYPEWWGAVGDGVTDDTNALQAAANFCFRESFKHLMLKTLRKTYRITSTLQIRCNADMSLSTITCDATVSPVIKVGDDNEKTSGFSFKGPYLHSATWCVGTGIQAINISHCDFTNTRVENFYIGLQVAAKNIKGNDFNTYRLGFLQNKKNLQIKPLDSGSWCNVNYFLGGKLAETGVTPGDPDSMNIEISSEYATDSPNGNVFVNCDFLGFRYSCKVFLNGRSNIFIGCYWEGPITDVIFYSKMEWIETRNNMFIGGLEISKLNTNCINLGYGNIGTLVMSGMVPLANADPNNPLSVKFYGSSLSPGTDNTLDLGSPTLRYGTVYAATGTINTSDSRAKTKLMPIENAEKNVALKIKSMIGKFQFLDAIDKKGKNNARIHFGTTAQDIAKAFESEGLDPHKYGMFCYDEWKEDPTSGIKAGNRYGVRYDELLAFLIAAM